MWRVYYYTKPSSPNWIQFYTGIHDTQLQNRNEYQPVMKQECTIAFLIYLYSKNVAKLLQLTDFLAVTQAT